MLPLYAVTESSGKNLRWTHLFTNLYHAVFACGCWGVANPHFGTDITHLTIEATYETQTRCGRTFCVRYISHERAGFMSIYFDTANSQFIIPETVITKPKVSSADTTLKSDLVFNYEG
jgi:hypothetical protein